MASKQSFSTAVAIFFLPKSLIFRTGLALFVFRGYRLTDGHQMLWLKFSSTDSQSRLPSLQDSGSQMLLAKRILRICHPWKASLPSKTTIEHRDWERVQASWPVRRFQRKCFCTRQESEMTSSQNFHEGGEAVLDQDSSAVQWVHKLKKLDSPESATKTN